MISVNDVAKAVLEEFKDPISTMKLQKLVYFVSGWHLGVLQEEMFSESFEAWISGPVSPILFDSHKNCKYEVSKDSFSFGSLDLLNDFELGLVKAVTKVYFNYTSYELSEICRRIGTPWSITRGNLPEEEPSHLIIDNNLTADYFRNLLNGEIFEESIL